MSEGHSKLAMALFAPITLVLMPLVWVVVVGAGDTAMFMAAGDYSWIGRSKSQAQAF